MNRALDKSLSAILKSKADHRRRRLWRYIQGQFPSHPEMRQQDKPGTWTSVFGFASTWRQANDKRTWLLIGQGISVPELGFRD